MIESERLLLSLPEARLAPAALDFHLRNADHLAPWSPPRPAGFGTLAFWNEYVDNSQIAFLQGSVVRLWMREKSEPEQIIGSVGFSQIVRGPFCNAVLGYQIDQTF
ncbi:MAG: GNAT family N-acetyltransferase, partial [Burkholderiales bacterium]